MNFFFDFLHNKFPSLFPPVAKDIVINPPTPIEYVPVVIPPKPEPLPPAPVVLPEKKSEIPPWIKIGVSLINTKETPGTPDNPEILHWAKEIGGAVGRDYIHDSIPWCGLFTAICLRLGGQPLIATPLWAASWDAYGTRLNEPAFGCIMRFARDGGGHVGFYISEDKDYYHILGGNQSDMVNITRIAKSRLVSCRWPPNADSYYRIGRIFKNFDGKVSVNEA